MSSKKSLDQKVYDMIHVLLEEKSQVKIQTSDEHEYDPLSQIALARDLRVSEIYTFVQARDMSTRRLKKVMLEKKIEEILRQVRKDEAEEMQSMGINVNDDSDDDKHRTDLVEYKDQNQANKSIVGLWNIKDPQTDSKDSLDQEKSKTEEESDKKSKKRSKDSGKPSKRQKEKKDRAPPGLTLSSLGGMSEIITELMELIGLPILHPEIYLSTGVEPPRGVLLHGPPGCGKTTIANALAGELGVPFISISAPSVVSGMSGESEKKVRELFEEAKSLAPCLVFIDEIDAITPKRDGGAQREMERRIVAQLLTSMDELSLEKTGGKPVIIMGATNRPDSLDSALRRAGRFDREICLNVPNESQRANILEAMTKNLKIDGVLDFLQLAKMTPGYVGADLKALTAAAGICAIKRIFEKLSEVEEKLLLQEVDSSNSLSIKSAVNDEDGEMMELDVSEISKPVLAQDALSSSKLSTIQRFLNKHPSPLTPEQLKPLCITYEDFLTALPTIQPTAKREGFATVPDVTWSNVGALSNIRVELNMAIVQPIKRPEIYEKVGITAPAGVLLWGPPGCGKTLLAKAVANESRANFISIKGPELLNKYVGESEKAVRQVFNRARASVPCIIFFDELDALVPRRDSSLSESSSRVVNTLLTELDGLNDRKGVFVIGATNRPDMIDPAMLRPGRLDKTLYIELPTLGEKVEILQTVVKVNNTPLDADVNLNVIASHEKCKNFSGADLSSLVREAGIIALKQKIFTQIGRGDETADNLSEINNILITQSDFANALNNIKPSVSDRDRMKYEKLNKKMGWSVINDEDEKSTIQNDAQGNQ